MAAFLIVDLDIYDADGFAEYRSRVPEFIAKYGGEYLVRGGDFEVIEGDWQPHRLVLFRFPDRQAIRNLLADPEYKKLASIRHKTAKTISVAVDGAV
jgi:uncharacterized protein (DUF1330 family)